MRVWLALIALLASLHQAAAFSTMVVEDCEAAWHKIMQAAKPHVQHSVSDDGWCQVIDKSGIDIDQIEWRAENLQRVLQQSLAPTALAIRITDADMLRTLGLGVKPDAPAMPMQITLVLRENAPAKQLLIETLLITGPKDNVLSLRGVFYDVDLSSLAKMQLSLGSAKLRDLVLIADGNRKLEPYLRPYIGATFPERSRRRSAMIDKVSDWPDHSFPPATKRAVQRLIAVLPAPNGTLRAEIDTGADLSAGLFVQTFLFGGSTKELGARILDGTVFHATWTAAE